MRAFDCVVSLHAAWMSEKARVVSWSKELGASARFRLRPLASVPMAALMTSEYSEGTELRLGAGGVGLPGLLGCSGRLSAGLSMQVEPRAVWLLIGPMGGVLGAADGAGGRGKA